MAPVIIFKEGTGNMQRGCCNNGYGDGVECWATMHGDGGVTQMR